MSYIHSPHPLHCKPPDSFMRVPHTGLCAQSPRLHAESPWAGNQSLRSPRRRAKGGGGRPKAATPRGVLQIDTNALSLEIRSSHSVLPPPAFLFPANPLPASDLHTSRPARLSRAASAPSGAADWCFPPQVICMPSAHGVPHRGVRSKLPQVSGVPAGGESAAPRAALGLSCYHPPLLGWSFALGSCLGKDSLGLSSGSVLSLPAQHAAAFRTTRLTGEVGLALSWGSEVTCPRRRLLWHIGDCLILTLPTPSPYFPSLLQTENE